ncbi:hypothetical protein GH714_038730 [Hevea brasiliensis]|uniref:BTB domain-containing protein n=1 Tax=Hevea brasiliensis TaxID=3981 RepID=A0A6A6L840_HEVBR|nr:hypothetical protein GH714_038730 [Hevea brasiliensis]
MDYRIGFSDSNEISNGSCTSCIETLSTPKPPNPEISALRQLSKSLESIFESPDFDYFADAKITISASNREVPVHRCILSARSSFFKAMFSGSAAKEKDAKFELKQLAKDYDVGFDSLVAVLAYLYSGKVRPLPDGVCVCADEDCSHVACRVAVDFMLEVLYASFTFQVPELVALYQRHLLDILDIVAIDDILVVLSVANMCDKACERLFARCIKIIVESDVDIVTLDKALPQHIVKQITDSRLEYGLETPESPDDAHALHYAVAYCDAKTATELLNLGIADVNLRNSRGYTVLHVAAMRKEPKIIVSLLTKGARPSDLTSDGRKALQISKTYQGFRLP